MLDSFRGQPLEFYVFVCMILLADSDGMVEMPVEKLADRISLPVDRVRRALESLSREHIGSRCRAENGARILRANGGWRIVNFVAYQSLSNEDAARLAGAAATVAGSTLGQRLSALRAGLCEMYKRHPDALWQSLEEHRLIEVARREHALAEFDEIKAFRARASRFPSNIKSLLERWNETLDRARVGSHTDEDAPLTVRLKAVEHLLSGHPANPESLCAIDKPTPEQKREYKELLAEREEIIRRIAGLKKKKKGELHVSERKRIACKGRDISIRDCARLLLPDRQKRAARHNRRS
jgi:DNA-binding Lrp family transcriptional regulator